MSSFIRTKYNLNDKNLVSVIDELPLWAAPFGLKLLDQINFKRNITVLDIGFGLGFPMLEIAMRLGDSCKVYGIDPWVTAIQRARLKAEIYQMYNVEFISGMAENIPLHDKSIDLITSNNGINNVEDLEATFSECSRISKTGAQFIFTFNLDGTMLEFYNSFKEVLNEKGMLIEIGNIDEHIYKKRKPLLEVKKLVSENGFTISRIIEDEFNYRFNDGTAMMNHFLIQLAFLESWRGLVSPNRASEIFNEIEQKLNNHANQNGELKLTIPFALFNCTRK
jgi:ubiquinone/menaquinone biosynthesis C-methylase UbiE